MAVITAMAGRAPAAEVGDLTRRRRCPSRPRRRRFPELRCSLTARASPARLLNDAGLATTARGARQQVGDVLLGRGLAERAGDRHHVGRHLRQAGLSGRDVRRDQPSLHREEHGAGGVDEERHGAGAAAPPRAPAGATTTPTAITTAWRTSHSAGQQPQPSGEDQGRGAAPHARATVARRRPRRLWPGRRAGRRRRPRAAASATDGHGRGGPAATPPPPGEAGGRPRAGSARAGPRGASAPRPGAGPARQATVPTRASTTPPRRAGRRARGGGQVPDSRIERPDRPAARRPTARSATSRGATVSSAPQTRWTGHRTASSCGLVGLVHRPAPAPGA